MGEVMGDDEQGGELLSMPILRSLLDFSTRMTNVSDDDRSKMERLDPEKLAWFNRALNDMVENTTDVFRESIATLGNDESDSDKVLRKEVALENLEVRVEQLDLAQGLHNLGGFAPVVDCLESVHPSIQIRACGVIATCVHNHASMQDAAVRLGALPKLLAIYSNRTVDSGIRSRALSAAGVLIRGNSTLELTFLHNQGLQMLRADMLLAEVQLRRKAVFTLWQLIASNPLLRAAVLKVEAWEDGKGKGILPELVATISFPDPMVSEFACRALHALLSSSWPGAGSSGPEVSKMFPELAGTLGEQLQIMIEACQGEEGDEHQMISKHPHTRSRARVPPARFIRA